MLKTRLLWSIPIFALAWPLSCSSSELSGPAGLDAGGDDTGPDTPPGPEPSSSPIGTSCTGSASDPKGKCPQGTVCYPSPGGYCTVLCGFATCPSGSVCIPTPKDGPLCARSCTADTDCRKNDGYSCDAAWKGCVQWGVTPKLATCPAAALPRTSFGTVTQLSTAAGPGRYHIEPSAAFDASGKLTTLYMARNDTFESNPLGSSTLTSGGQLTADRTFTASSKELFDTWMARARTGKLHAVWFGNDGFDTNSKIGYATSTDGVAWTSERNILEPSDCPDTGCTDKPMVAIGPDPADAAKEIVYVLYATPTGERVLRSLDGGATFTKGALLSGFGVYGDVEVAQNGTVHVVGANITSTSNPLGDVANRIQYATSNDGGRTFSTIHSVEDPAEPTPWYFSNPQVVFDTLQSKAHIVYAAGTPDGKWNIRLATSADGGLSFTRITVNDDAPCANHATPTIAIEPATGKLHVAWIENRGGVGRVAYAACAADGSRCNANEAISDQPFGSYELVRHSPQWMGEYFALLVDPTGTKLHAVWTQPVAESTAVRSRIFHAARGL